MLPLPAWRGSSAPALLLLCLTCFCVEKMPFMTLTY